jgi:hypothetical protein
MVKAMVKGKHKPPSRVRYEGEHPTVTCRVSLELKAKLDEAREKYELSFADILKIGLRVQGAAANAALRQVRAGRCWRCEKPYVWDLRTKEGRDKLGGYIPANAFTHADCEKGIGIVPNFKR